MKQALYFVPPDKKVAVPERPDRVWTLISRDVTSPDRPPGTPPMSPTHGKDAWLEDVVHDWNWRAGILRYYSRVADHGVWILCEYDSAKKAKERKP